jgi:hypothetical protein
LRVRIAAALVSLDGHMKIRHKPNFVDSAFLGFSNRKGMTMRIFIASAIAAGVALGTPPLVQAQAQGTPPQSQAQTPPAQPNKLIQSVQIVNVTDLKPEMRSKVDGVVARTSEEDMQSLRKSIDATPEATSALRAKGLTSSQVVAINIAGGVLTLFAKTA